MLTNRTTLALVGVALIAFSAACPAQDSPAARAIVTGPEKRLAEFHQNVLGNLPSSNLDEAAITCATNDSPPKDCQTLNRNANTTKTLTYVFLRDHERLEAFVLAWGKLQTTSSTKLVKITFDMDFTEPDCGPPLPQPCFSAPFCKLTPGCDKVQGAPCQKCAP